MDIIKFSTTNYGITAESCKIAFFEKNKGFSEFNFSK